MTKTWKHETTGIELEREPMLLCTDNFKDLLQGFTVDKSKSPAPRILKNMQVGPFVSISSGNDYRYGYAMPADSVLTAIAKGTINIPGDTISFHVIDHNNGYSLIVAQHSRILGDIWIAYVRNETLPKA